VSSHIPIEELEALAASEIPAEQAAALKSHLESCASCQSELSWLRAERELFSGRARPPRFDAVPTNLWQGIEARLPAVPPIAAMPQRKRAGRLTGSGLGVVAAAAAMLVMLSVGAVGGLHLRERTKALFGQSTSRSHFSVHISSSGDAEKEPLTATAEVSGPVTLRITTASADIAAQAGSKDRVRIWVSDSEVKAVALSAETRGELRALFDGNSGLDLGSVRLELPAGSRLEVTTASGDVSVAGIGGDLRVRTASGDVHASDVRTLELDTASGDITVEELLGSAQIHTVAGDVRLKASGAPLTAVELRSVSGELELEAGCAADCRVTATTVSGDVQLRTRPGSSYTLRFRSQAGEFLDDNDAPADEDNDREASHSKTIRIGSGAGSIDVTTGSGDLQMDRS